LRFNNICFQFSKSIYIIPLLIFHGVHSKNTTNTVQKKDLTSKKDNNDIGIYVFVALGAIAFISATFFICYHSYKTIKRRIRAKVFPYDHDAGSSKSLSTNKDTNIDSLKDEKATRRREADFARDIRAVASQSWPQMGQRASIEKDLDDDVVPEGFLGRKKSFIELQISLGVPIRQISAEMKAHASAPAMLEHKKEDEEVKAFQSFLD
jgi:hypothetical protein